MTTSLARYHARAPRYVLDTIDNNLIRLSGAERRSWEESTEIKDISLTGVSFTAPSDLSPQLGEMIKIQFSVPGSEQMACHAVVIRIEKLTPYENLIGVHFYKLERLQRLNLVQGLSDTIR
ncbi:MAG: PilZ domain-containing protein, partial [Bdellovibrionaceae bacterium]|nr:PilZ domain-containing protein [Pseudobdellovibrionaceae bacterium]